MQPATAHRSLPGWLKPANRLVVALQRLGMSMGTIHTLTVPGRVTGTMHTTPVSLMVVDSARYIVGGMADADWVKNVRAAGWGIIAYGRRRERATLIELSVEERAAILRDFPRLVPAGVSFFRRLYDLPSDQAALPDAFASLATQATVFCIVSATSEP
ncbi:MAG: nitroreductase/quinone reductase family protein [Ktedonobacterales bacterium]